MSTARPSVDAGFSLVELMTVVLIIGILVTVSLAVFRRTEAAAAESTCYGNQRAIEGAVQTWTSQAPEREKSDLEGLVDGDHALVPSYVAAPPRCPSAGSPGGLYTLDAQGTVGECSFGDPAHKHF